MRFFLFLAFLASVNSYAQEGSRPAKLFLDTPACQSKLYGDNTPSTRDLLLTEKNAGFWNLVPEIGFLDKDIQKQNEVILSLASRQGSISEADSHAYRRAKVQLDELERKLQVLRERLAPSGAGYLDRKWFYDLLSSNVERSILDNATIYRIISELIEYRGAMERFGESVIQSPKFRLQDFIRCIDSVAKHLDKLRAQVDSAFRTLNDTLGQSKRCQIRFDCDGGTAQSFLLEGSGAEHIKAALDSLKLSEAFLAFAKNYKAPTNEEKFKTDRERLRGLVEERRKEIERLEGQGPTPQDDEIRRILFEYERNPDDAYVLNWLTTKAHTQEGFSKLTIEAIDHQLRRNILRSLEVSSECSAIKNHTLYRPHGIEDYLKKHREFLVIEAESLSVNKVHPSWFHENFADIRKSYLIYGIRGLSEEEIRQVGAIDDPLLPKQFLYREEPRADLLLKTLKSLVSPACFADLENSVRQILNPIYVSSPQRRALLEEIAVQEQVYKLINGIAIRYYDLLDKLGSSLSDALKAKYRNEYLDRCKLQMGEFISSVAESLHEKHSIKIDPAVMSNLFKECDRRFQIADQNFSSFKKQRDRLAKQLDAIKEILKAQGYEVDPSDFDIGNTDQLIFFMNELGAVGRLLSLIDPTKLTKNQSRLLDSVFSPQVSINGKTYSVSTRLRANAALVKEFQKRQVELEEGLRKGEDASRLAELSQSMSKLIDEYFNAGVNSQLLNTLLERQVANGEVIQSLLDRKIKRLEAYEKLLSEGLKTAALTAATIFLGGTTSPVLAQKAAAFRTLTLAAQRVGDVAKAERLFKKAIWLHRASESLRIAGRGVLGLTKLQVSLGLIKGTAFGGIHAYYGRSEEAIDEFLLTFAQELEAVRDPKMLLFMVAPGVAYGALGRLASAGTHLGVGAKFTWDMAQGVWHHGRTVASLSHEIEILEEKSNRSTEEESKLTDLKIKRAREVVEFLNATVFFGSLARGQFQHAKEAYEAARVPDHLVPLEVFKFQDQKIEFYYDKKTGKLVESWISARGRRDIVGTYDPRAPPGELLAGVRTRVLSRIKAVRAMLETSELKKDEGLAQELQIFEQEIDNLPPEVIIGIERIHLIGQERLGAIRAKAKIEGREPTTEELKYAREEIWQKARELRELIRNNPRLRRALMRGVVGPLTSDTVEKELGEVSDKILEALLKVDSAKAQASKSGDSIRVKLLEKIEKAFEPLSKDYENIKSQLEGSKNVPFKNQAQAEGRWLDLLNKIDRIQQRLDAIVKTKDTFESVMTMLMVVENRVTQQLSVVTNPALSPRLSIAQRGYQERRFEQLRNEIQANLNHLNNTIDKLDFIDNNFEQEAKRSKEIADQLEVEANENSTEFSDLDKITHWPLTMQDLQTYPGLLVRSAHGHSPVDSRDIFACSVANLTPPPPPPLPPSPSPGPSPSPHIPFTNNFRGVRISDGFLAGLARESWDLKKKQKFIQKMLESLLHGYSQQPKGELGLKVLNTRKVPSGHVMEIKLVDREFAVQRPTVRWMPDENGNFTILEVRTFGEKKDLDIRKEQ